MDGKIGALFWSGLMALGISGAGCSSAVNLKSELSLKEMRQIYAFRTSGDLVKDFSNLVFNLRVLRADKTIIWNALTVEKEENLLKLIGQPVSQEKIDSSLLRSGYFTGLSYLAGYPHPWHIELRMKAVARLEDSLCWYAQHKESYATGLAGAEVRDALLSYLKDWSEPHQEPRTFPPMTDPYEVVPRQAMAALGCLLGDLEQNLLGPEVVKALGNYAEKDGRGGLYLNTKEAAARTLEGLAEKIPSLSKMKYYYHALGETYRSALRGKERFE